MVYRSYTSLYLLIPNSQSYPLPLSSPSTTTNLFFMTVTCFCFIWGWVCMCAWLYPTLCNSMDCSPPGSSVHRIFQARMLEWVAISYSNVYLYIIYMYVYGSWWWTGKPGMLWFMGWQRVRHDWATELMLHTNLSQKEGSTLKAELNCYHCTYVTMAAWQQLHAALTSLSKGLASAHHKGPERKYLRAAGHVSSVTATQLCYFRRSCSWSIYVNDIAVFR